MSSRLVGPWRGLVLPAVLLLSIPRDPARAQLGDEYFEKLRVERLDAFGDAGAGSSTAIDAMDRQHIAYYATEGCCDLALKYALQDSTGWHFEVVVPDSGFADGARASIALDAAGEPHIAFYDSRSRTLRYARRSGLSWQTETADSNGDVGRYASLDLDANDVPHVSYYDAANQNLKFVRKNGATWQPQTVDNAGNVGLHTSLRVDGIAVHVSYYDATQQDLKYVRGAGGVFSVAEIVDGGGDAGFDASLALDGSGNPLISYFANPSFKSLKLATKNGVSWQLETINSSNDFPRSSGTSLALDPNDSPRIAYGRSGSVNSVYKDGNQWRFDPVADVQPAQRGVQSVSLALDADAKPHISFYSRAHRDLMSMSLTRGWRIEQLQEGDTSRGSHASLAIRDGIPSIAYTGVEGAQAEEGIYLRTRSGNVWSPPDKVWPDFDATSLVATSSLALNAQGLPRLSFYVDGYCTPTCDFPKDLMFAWQDGVTNDWNVETVATQGDVGRFQRLILDANDVPTIVFLDETAGQIKLARRAPFDRRRGSAWQILPQTLTVQSQPGVEPPIAALGLPGGSIVVSHYSVPQSETNGDLRLGTWDGVSWSDSLIDGGTDANSPPDVGRSSSLAYDATENRLTVVYKLGDDIIDGVKFAYRDNGGVWHAEELCFLGTPVLGLGGGSWKDPRIASTYDGGVGFSFLDVYPGVNPFCRQESVDTAEAVSPAMVVDDIEHIAYFDDDFRQLRYAERTLPPPFAQPAAQEEDPDSDFPTNFTQICQLQLPSRGVGGCDACICILSHGQDCGRRIFTIAELTERGADLLQRFCPYASELDALFVAEPELARDASLVLQDLRPGAEALFEGRGSQVTLSEEMIEETTDVLDRLDAVASSGLRASLFVTRAEMGDPQDLVGATFDEAATRLGLTALQRVAILLDPWLFGGVIAFCLVGPRIRRRT